MPDRPLTVSAALRFSWGKVTHNVPVVVIAFGLFEWVSYALMHEHDLRIVWWLWSALGYLLLAKLSLILCDDERISVRSLFGCYRMVLPYLAANLLFTAMAAVGFLMVVIPGLIVVASCWPFAYIIIDRKLGPIAALRASMHVSEPVICQVLLLFVTMFASIGAAHLLLSPVVGRRAVYVSGAVATPFLDVALAYFYRTLSPLQNGQTDSHAISEELV